MIPKYGDTCNEQNSTSYEQNIGILTMNQRVLAMIQNK